MKFIFIAVLVFFVILIVILFTNISSPNKNRVCSKLNIKNLHFQQLNPIPAVDSIAETADEAGDSFEIPINTHIRFSILEVVMFNRRRYTVYSVVYVYIYINETYIYTYIYISICTYLYI
jgi:hypothetical protein